MSTESSYFKLFSILTLLFFLNSCTSVHTLKDTHKGKINEIKHDNIVIIHHGDVIFRLDNINLAQESITGQVKTYEMSKDQRTLYNELHLFICPDVNRNIKLDDSITVEIKEINRVKIYEHDLKKATNNLFVGSITLAIVFFVVYGLVGSIKYIHLLH